MKNEFYRRIMRDIDASRIQAENRAENDRLILYESHPRLGEIDREVSRLWLKLAGKAFSFDKQINLPERDEIDLLKEERAFLLNKIGVKEADLLPVYGCSFCSDTGFISMESGESKRCNCVQQKLIDMYYSLSGIKGILETENFDAFDFDLFSREAINDKGLSPRLKIESIYKSAKEFVRDFGKVFTNYIYYGKVGSGKTFMCHCITRALIKKGHTVLYITAPRLFRFVEEYRFHRETLTNPEYIAEALDEVDLLIIDDLGTETSTAVTQSAFFDIVNQRLLTQKPTIISTNRTPKELQQDYSERIISRLVGNYTKAVFVGEDLRAKKKFKLQTSGGRT